MEPNKEQSEADRLLRGEQRDSAYWAANRRLILILMTIWAIFPLGLSILLGDYLNEIPFFGVPLGFWLGHQGSIYVFVVLIAVYVWQMGKLDKRHAEEQANDN